MPFMDGHYVSKLVRTIYGLVFVEVALIYGLTNQSLAAKH